MDAPDQQIAPCRLGPFDPIQQRRHPAGDLVVGRQFDPAAAQLGLDACRQAVGLVQLDAGGMNAPCQQSEGKRLLLSLGHDLEGRRHVDRGGQSLRSIRADGAPELLLDELADLRGAHLDTVGQPRSNRPRDGVGVVEVQPATHQIAGDHAAQETLTQTVAADYRKRLSTAFRRVLAGLAGGFVVLHHFSGAPLPSCGPAARAAVSWWSRREYGAVSSTTSRAMRFAK